MQARENGISARKKVLGKKQPRVKTLLKQCPAKVEGRPAKKIRFPAKFEIKIFPGHVIFVSPLKSLLPRQKIYKFQLGYT